MAIPLPNYSIAFSDGIVFEIDPRIELLAGAQSQTSWVKAGRRGPGNAPSDYFRDLEAWFSPFKNDSAVKSTQNLLSLGFSYDAPCAFVLNLEGGAAFEKPDDGWTPYLKKRAIFPWTLDSFARNLSRLYLRSDFPSFLARHEADYRRWLAAATEGVDPQAMVEWLEDFFGEDGSPVYHFILAPAMYPGGGYGFSRFIGSGDSKRLHIYQIVRSGNEGKDAFFPSGASLIGLGLHEFGHSYVNPVIEKGSGDKRLKALFEPVKKEMKDMAYSDTRIFMNELVLRAAVIIAMRDLGMATEARAQLLIEREESQGFYPVREVVKLLEAYAAARERYPDFASYGSVLLESLARDASALAGRWMILHPLGRGGKDAVSSFSEGFEGGLNDAGLPPGFFASIGSSISGGGGGQSEYRVAEREGRKALYLSADDSTSSWRIITRPVSVKAGSLSLRYRASGEGIRKATGQYGGSYVGFILTGKDGKRIFEVSTYSGDFPWQDCAHECAIDPKAVKAIDFAIFLNESGILMVDDIVVGYK